MFTKVVLTLFASMIFAGCAVSFAADTQTKNPAANTKKAAEALSSGPYSGEAVLCGKMPEGEMVEISGICSSQLEKNRFYMLNDSGNDPVLYAINDKGNLVSQTGIANATNTDWEDIASFRLKDKPVIMIGDIGDNSAKREKCKLFFIDENEFAKTPVATSVNAFMTIRFTYEDGARDCESLAYDPVAGAVVLLSKRDERCRLYVLPMSEILSAGQRRLTARKVADIDVKELAGKTINLSELKSPWSLQPTAMDISADGRWIIFQTYVTVHVFERQEDAPAKLLCNQVQTLKLPKLPQSESCCFSQDGNIMTTSEKSEQPLYMFNRKR